MSASEKAAPGRPTQAEVNAANARFWDEACGSVLARDLGITERTAESYGRYDRFYFSMYPYLFKHVPFSSVRGRSVLEVGIGHGNVAQRLAESGARYTGLDIAAGAVESVRHRFAVAGLSGALVRASILDAPFADRSFDHVVGIGSYQHTGNLQRALDETWRLLRPGGSASLMVYNAYSYRRWIRFLAPTLRYWLWDVLGRGEAPRASTPERSAYDHDSLGDTPPATEFASRRRLRRMTSDFRRFHAELEQSGGMRLFGLRGRLLLCRTLGRAWGLDIYFRLQK